MSFVGQIKRRSEAPRASAYVVCDCETTGTQVGLDEIVSVAVVRLDSEGREVGRYVWLVHPSRSIPAAATAVHGIADEDVSAAPGFAEIADELFAVLDGAVFVAHNAPFDLAMLRNALGYAGIDYRPSAVACTLEVFRLLEPTAADHRLASLCARHRVVLEDAHDALSDALATAALLRLLLHKDLAPETARLDVRAFMRIRARGDMRPASPRQMRRVFALANAAEMTLETLLDLVARTTGVCEIDSLTREQVQDVFDNLEGLPAGSAARQAA